MKTKVIIHTFFFTLAFMLCSIISISQEVLVDAIGKDSPPPSSSGVKRGPDLGAKANSVGEMGSEKSKNNPTFVTSSGIDMNSNKIDPKLIVSLSILNNEIKILKSELKKNKSNEDIAFMLKKQIKSLKDRKKQIKKLKK